jgi:glycosyltransferase involved in cell wall biosynthesis
VNAAPARLLDLTRLVSRLGSGPPTGIDRVERAWLAHLCAQEVPCFGLVRTGPGFLLLDRGGMRALLAMTAGAPIPEAGRFALRWRRDRRRAAAETAARSLAIDSRPRWRLGSLLRGLPVGTDYLNVGHSNLTKPGLARIKATLCGRIIVLVHDTIPLDHPDFARPGVPARFGRKLAAVAAGADLVIYSTTDARQRAERHFARLGRIPPCRIAPLGVDLCAPDAFSPVLTERPFFLALGTVEPRKNIGFLLDLWDDMARSLPDTAIPALILAGRRGWDTPALFKRIARSPHVTQYDDLTDGAVVALLDKAAGLLFPSHAEGFGLPVAEAVARACPVVCQPLSAIHETVGNYPVYLSTEARYAWYDCIMTLIRTGRDEAIWTARLQRGLPVWKDHFNTVLTLS